MYARVSAFSFLAVSFLVMSASITVDTTGFTAMCRDLSRMTGASMHEVIRSETRTILQTCMSRTGAMSKQGITRLANRFVARANTYASPRLAGQGKGPDTARGVYPRISVAPGAGKAWWIDKGPSGSGPTFYIMKGGTRRWSNERWALYQGLEAERQAFKEELLAQLPRIYTSRGVGKASWLRIADDLSIKLQSVPDYVSSAQPRNGPRVDGIGRQFQDAHQFYIEIENRNQILIRRQNGSIMLQRAVDGRKKFFATNMAHGVFNDINAIAKKYPGITVVPLALAA